MTITRWEDADGTMATALTAALEQRDEEKRMMATRRTAPPRIEPVFDAHGRNMLSSLGRYRHKKTGKVYRLFTTALVEATLEPVVVYGSPHDVVTWTRPVSEWTERFEIVEG